MSKDAKNSIAYGLQAILIVVAILIACWGFGWVAGGVAQWWKDVTYVKHESLAEQKAQDEYDREKAQKDLEAQLKDPSSHAAVRKKCLDSGGYPGSDGWGNIQCHTMEHDK